MGRVVQLIYTGQKFSLSERDDTMREFSWNVFAVTGNIEAYLLFKECEGPDCYETEQQEEVEEPLELH
jgi:hypothetical protein